MPTRVKFTPSVLTSTARARSVLSEDCACAGPAANRPSMPISAASAGRRREKRVRVRPGQASGLRAEPVVAKEASPCGLALRRAHVMALSLGSQTPSPAHQRIVAPSSPLQPAPSRVSPRCTPNPIASSNPSHFGLAA